VVVLLRLAVRMAGAVARPAIARMAALAPNTAGMETVSARAPAPMAPMDIAP